MKIFGQPGMAPKPVPNCGLTLRIEAESSLKSTKNGAASGVKMGQTMPNSAPALTLDIAQRTAAASVVAVVRMKPLLLRVINSIPGWAFRT